MIRSAVRTVAAAVGLRAPGRMVEVLDDDAFVVSYPKSGNTWIRFLIGNLVQPEREVTFLNVNGIIPDIYRVSATKLRKLPRPRLLKSHEYFDPRYRRVIYVVRDPRDVLVSYFHYHLRVRHVPEGYPLEHYVEQFLHGQLSPFGTWRENVGSWLGARGGRADFLLLRYEELHHDPGRELRRVAGFLGLDPDQAALDRAIERSSAGRMRELERSLPRNRQRRRTRRPDKPFIRAAAAGGWRRELPSTLATEVAAAWGPIMAELGYIDGPSAPASADTDATPPQAVGRPDAGYGFGRTGT